jgi:hypothetical protein
MGALSDGLARRRPQDGGRKFSFFGDLQYRWVGPISVTSKLFLKLGIRW